MSCRRTIGGAPEAGSGGGLANRSVDAHIDDALRGHVSTLMWASTLRPQPRLGVALILALAVLAALLMLGLPFLFSQAASLGSARAVAEREDAQSQRVSAETLATMAGIRAVETLFQPNGTTDAGDVLRRLGAVGGTPAGPLRAASPDPTRAASSDPFPDNRAAIDEAAFLGAPADPLFDGRGAWISDDSGRLDPNSLTIAGWDMLFRALGITDWDDDAVVHSDHHHFVNATTNEYRQSNDADSYGELARAMIERRRSITGNRFTRLEQLLEADTGHWRDLRNGFTYPSPTAPTARFGKRSPLTRSELEKLRPYLTLSQPRPGRQGVIDAGNHLYTHISYHNNLPSNGESGRTFYLDANLQVGRVLGYGSRVRRPGAGAGGWDPNDGQVGQVGARASSYNLRWGDWQQWNPALGAAIGVEVSPPLNLNAAPTLLWTMFGLTRGGSPLLSGGDLRGLSSTLGGTALERTDPLSTIAAFQAGLAVELPPVGIRPTGVISVEAAAVVHDAQGRAVGQSTRSLVLQALPQEVPVEHRWITQGQLLRLVSQRQASNLEAWPKAYRRLVSELPDDPATTATIAAGTGLRPAALPTVATGIAQVNTTDQGARHLAIDWLLDLGQKRARASLLDLVTTAGNQQPIGGVVPPGTTMTPEGLHLTGGIAWNVTDATGMLRSFDAANPELRGRQFSLWLKPDADLSGDVHCLAEGRMESDPRLIAPRADGSLPATDQQNYLGLFHETLGGEQQLVLVIAPPSADHSIATAGGLPMPDDIRTTYALDERSLGGGSVPVSPATDQTIAGVTTSISALYKPGRILLVWRLGKDPGDATKPYFRKDRWVHLQCELADGGEDGAHLIVDGHVGQDVLRSVDSAAVTLGSQHGNYLRFPCFPLRTELPQETDPTGNATINLPSIQVASVNGVTAGDVLPARGMIRIDDEFLSYDSVSASTFTGVHRGERQDTQTDYTASAPMVHQRFPYLQGHRGSGDHALVVPGGYRLRQPNGTAKLYRGGATLTDGFPPGDPSATYYDGTAVAAANPHQYRIWARLDPSVLPQATSGNVNFRRLPAGTATITLLRTHGPTTVFRWPNPGIVRIRDEFIRYERAVPAGTQIILQNCSAIDQAAFQPQYAPAGAPEVDPWYGAGAGYSAPAVQYRWDDIEDIPADFLNAAGNRILADSVSLVGVPLTMTESQDILDIRNKNLFKVTNGPGPNETVPEYTVDSSNRRYPTFLAQVRDPNGRIEWILYHQFVKALDGRFFLLLRPGWGGNDGTGTSIFRGKERTALSASAIDRFDFPAGSALLPVQIEIAGGHVVATGDVQTYQPRTKANHLAFGGTLQPLTMRVRYAACDGYDATDSGMTAYDTKNGDFAFDSAIPLSMPLGLAQDYDLLCGLGWSARDLTKRSPVAMPRGHLPRIDLWDGPLTPFDGLPARLVIGSADTTRGGTANTTAFTVDGVVAGDLPQRRGDDLDTWGRIVRVLRAGSDLDGIPAGAVSGLTVISDRPILARENSTGIGLIRIDGEVFAYRSPTAAERTAAGGGNQNTIGVLVGRGLLDGATAGAVAHRVRLAPGEPTGLPAQRVALGPVVLTPTAGVQYHRPQQWSGFNDAGIETSIDPDAPALLLADPDDVAVVHDVLMAPARSDDPTATPPVIGGLITAEWLRGLYATGRTLGAGTQRALAIGFWGRYPSALPRAADATAQHFRSRAFAWAGFPLAVWGARFDATRFLSMSIPMATVSSTFDPDDPFTLEARALASGHDWTAAVGSTLTASLDFDVTSAFPQSTGDVDAMELRVTWHYKAAPGDVKTIEDIAWHANTAPTIQAVRMRCLAPSRVLSIDTAR